LDDDLLAEIDELERELQTSIHEVRQLRVEIEDRRKLIKHRLVERDGIIQREMLPVS
jgi:regulator of replication initiation timing